MIRRLLAWVVGTTMVGAALAQEAEKPTLDEDIEVMRQILQDRLAPVQMSMTNCVQCHMAPNQQYSELRVGSMTLRASQGFDSGNYSILGMGGPGLPGHGWQVLGPHDPHHGIAALAQLEGAHLSGYGVVYTVTLPVPGSDPRPTSPDAPPRELTEWEKVRGQLRGEKVPEKKPTKSKSETVGDIILGALARNGKNIGIEPTEKVTIVVTFRPETKSSQVRWDGKRDSVVRNIFVDDHERRGDVLMGSGKPNEAIHAYVRSAGYTRSDDHNKYRLLRKLAQAYIQAGDLDKGQEMLDKLKAVQEEQEQTEEKARDYNVPAKLTISATRKQLEDLASEKLSMEEFRKAITIEYRPLPGKEKK